VRDSNQPRPLVSEHRKSLSTVDPRVSCACLGLLAARKPHFVEIMKYLEREKACILGGGGNARAPNIAFPKGVASRSSLSTMRRPRPGGHCPKTSSVRVPPLDGSSFRLAHLCDRPGGALSPAPPSTSPLAAVGSGQRSDWSPPAPLRLRQVPPSAVRAPAGSMSRESCAPFAPCSRTGFASARICPK